LADELRYIKNVIFPPSQIFYHGVAIPLCATPEIRQVRKQIYRGLYEAAELGAVEKYVRLGDTVAEIGAGLGIVSVALAKKAGDPSRVHSFEANPKLKRSFDAMAGANRLQLPLNIAFLGAGGGQRDLFVSGEFLSSSFVDRGAKETRKIRVNQTDFQETIAQLNPTIVVIDAEGAEAELLAVALPPSVEVLIVEFHPHVIGDAAVTEIAQRLISSGFQIALSPEAGHVQTFLRGSRVRSGPENAASQDALDFPPDAAQ